MRLDWASSSLADLDKIDHWLLVNASGVIAVDTLLAIERRAGFLADFPFGGPAIPDTGLRSLRVSRTPYILIYRVDVDRVEILRVRHERENWRDPA